MASSPAVTRRVDPLVAGVEASGVPDHPDQPGLLLEPQAGLGVAERVSEGDLDLHVLSGPQGGLGLLGVQRCRGGEDDGVDVVHGEDVVEGRDGPGDAVLVREGARTVEAARHDGGDLDALDAVQCRDVLGAERAAAGEGDAQRLRCGHVTPSPRPTARGRFCRIRCPTAVFDAGTW